MNYNSVSNTDELWLRILEAEKQEQIMVKIQVNWVDFSDPTSLFQTLYGLFGDGERKSKPLKVF